MGWGVPWSEMGARVRSVAALGAGLAIAIGPVAARNYFVADDFVLITSQAGQNFYIGNNRGNESGVYKAPPFVIAGRDASVVINVVRIGNVLETRYRKIARVHLVINVIRRQRLRFTLPCHHDRECFWYERIRLSRGRLNRDDDRCGCFTRLQCACSFK